MSIKVDIISGFLGAGKTTLIKKLFETGFNDEKVVLIENEFGEIGIDSSFLKESGVNIKEINSGCICCSLVGDFATSLTEVINKFSPERIIIEPSGVGKLSDIVKAVSELNLDLKLNIVTTVVDGGKCKLYMKNFGEFFNNQVEVAKTIVISKVEKLSDEKLLEDYNLLKEKNPNANIILASLPIVDSQKLLDTLEKNSSGIEEFKQELESDHHCCCEHHHHEHEEGHCCEHHHHEHEEGHCCEHHHHEHEEGHCCEHHHHEHEEGHCCEHHHHEHEEGHCCEHHHAEEVFTSYGFEITKAYSKSEIEVILESLKNEDECGVVLRAKGILRSNESEQWHYIDYVAGDYQIRNGAPEFIGKFVVIGSQLNKENLEKLLMNR